MASKSFEDLRVYQLAEQLADFIWKLILKWPALARNTVGAQMVRSADSIGANIAEGSGRGTYADNRRFVRMARGSLYETRHWLRRAFTQELLKREDVSKLKPIVGNLGPQLNGYLNSIGRNATKNPKPPDQSPKTND